MPKFSSWVKRVKNTFRSKPSRPRSTSWSVRTDTSTSTSSSKEEQFLHRIYSKWDSAVVVVVGASAGIGSAICISLVKRGFTVVGCSKTSELLNALSEECTERNFKGKLYAYKNELLHENDVKDLFAWVHKKFGRIDVLINNPDLVNDHVLKRLPPETLSSVVQRRILTLILSTKEAAKYMMRSKDGKGHIFNICSTVDIIATEYARIMSSSSPSTRRASRGLRLDSIEKSKIVVTAISPGKSEADLFRRIYGQKYVDLSPLSIDNYFTPQEVANTLVYSLANS
ncbi:unnamed protein product [Allacma fusca]|uniref:Dehydrogenase/reductase SDR family member 11 n=1 Tax=Allacma fusca TaxID=39272 RepID=A0A8J2KSN5_9HEXA|nr:unnamed protein product [Allacma fusca]